MSESQERPVARKDEIETLIGSFGKYQIFLIFLMIPCKIPTSVQSLGIVFLAPPVNFTCNDNGTSLEEFNCPCDNPEFDEVLFGDTMITRWRLICDKTWLVSFSQTCLMLGVLIGSIVFGFLSDRYGRKFSLVVANLLELCAGVASSFASEFWLYIVFRFFIGASVGGILIVSFVLVIEFTGVKYRELVTCLLQIPFNMGYLLLPIFGYLTTTWVWLNLAYSLPAVVFVLLYWVLPETPKWLLMAGKTEEAIATVVTAAKINNRPLENIRQTILDCTGGSQENAKKGTILDLFKTPNMRKNMLCLIANWTTSGLCFYGVSQYIGQLNGNIFINVSISAVLNVAGTFVIYMCLKFLPRRTAMIAVNLATSACLLIIAATPDTMAVFKVVLACIGNLCSFTGYIVIYLYTAELFPTVVRNIAMGVTSMFSRVGAMIAPFVVLLKMNAIWIPPVVFGIAPLFAGLLCLLLPETKHRELPSSLEESERINLKQINRPSEVNQ